MRRRNTWLAALGVSLVLAAAACSRASQPTFLGKDRINIGFKSDQPGTGQAPDYHGTGFDYRVGERITRTLGVTMADRLVPSADRIPSLTKTKKNDLVIATFSITKQRMGQIDFVGPYLTNRQGILVGQKSDIHGVPDLKGKYICTYKGTTSAEYLNEHKIGIVVIKDTASQCIDAMLHDPKRSRPVAMSTDELILYGFADQHKAEGLHVLPGVTFGPPQMYGIGMAKGHRADCARLLDIVKEYVGSNDWLDDLKTSLPQVTENKDWETAYLPSDESILNNSCTDPGRS